MTKSSSGIQTVTIAIDPELKTKYGPEICWTWRLLLSSIGFAWQEVTINCSKCDIAYSSDLSCAARCRIFICANKKCWKNKSNFRLATLGRLNGSLFPVYKDDTYCPLCFHTIDSCLVCERDIIFDLFWLITGQEEHFWPKNKYGFFNLETSVYRREQIFPLALASSISISFEKLLKELSYVNPLPRWPNGKQAAACIGHDVDYPEIIRWIEPLRVLIRQGMKGISVAGAILTGKRNHWHFKSWVHLEKSLHVQSAFYFVARQGSLLKYLCGTPDPFYDIHTKAFKELFKYLKQEGFEIGLHACYQAFESLDRMKASKQSLEEASRQKIYGIRHHFWHLNPDAPESTLLMHEKISIKYDSSLFHERYIGWRRGLNWPFFPFHQKERRELKTLQIPTALMDDQLFGHQKYNPGNRLDILKTLINKTAEYGGCLFIDVHNYVFDELLYPDWCRTYRWLLDLLISRSDFWIDTPARIAEHWNQRYSKIINTSKGLIAKGNFQ